MVLYFSPSSSCKNLRICPELYGPRLGDLSCDDVQILTLATFTVWGHITGARGKDMLRLPSPGCQLAPSPWLALASAWNAGG